MTKFNLDSGIYTPSTPDPVEKYPKAQALAAAYWISYFTLHWLLTLEVIELTTARAATTIYFLLSAVIVTIMTAAHDVMEKKE